LFERKEPDGSVYKGALLDGIPHGKGQCSGPQWFADGRRYVGEFKMGVPEGEGELFWPNQDHYKGTYSHANDGRHGRVKMTYTTGGGDDGDWDRDQTHGQGELEFGDEENTIYKGAWDHGAMHGHGEIRTKNSFYSGNFVKNQASGQGQEEGVDGSHYQ